MIAVTACPLCGNASLRHYVTGKDYLDNVPGEWRYDQCDGCSYVFLNPRPAPEELGKLYNPDEAKLHFHHVPAGHARPGFKDQCEADAFINRMDNRGFGPKSFIGSLRGAFRAVNLRITLCPRHTDKESNILEIGSGNGEYIGFLKRVGYRNIHATELNAAAARAIGDKYGLTVWSEDFRSIPELKRRKYAFITANMVLEHVDDPASFIDGAFELLEDGGTFAFCVPNIEGVEMRLFGGHAYGLQPPFHLSQFSRKSLMSLLGKFKEVEFYFHHVDRDWVASAEFRYRERPGALNRLLAIGSNKLVRKLVVKPLVYLLSMLGMTSRMSVYARK